MRRSAILASSLGLAAVFALPVAAQPVPPTLAYVQPLPVPAGPPLVPRGAADAQVFLLSNRGPLHAQPHL